MSTASIIILDLLAGLLAAGGWLGAGAASATGRRRLTLGLVAGAALATLARAGTTVALARAGWWFAGEKVLIGGPLAVAALAAAALSRKPLPLLFAGYATVAGVLVTVLHGYPASAGGGLLAAAGVAGATLVSWRLLGGRPPRAAIAAAVAALVAGTGLAVMPGTAPAAPHHHASAAPELAPPEAAPPGTAVPGAGVEGSAVEGSAVEAARAAGGARTERFTLTAGTTTVRVGGHEVAAWAFNGQVPGPQLTATLGDTIEVTLRNRDIGRGVTLHWHGYDVPNSQDGVPGVTQDAVLPGRQFVYRFRADQPGTYWYHTHEASDVGVRMGLYGVLVVHPKPVTGVEVTIPVHTLAGNPLPAARTEHVAAGAPVRLRLINTDSTTHRYALAGTAFLVAAIDGADLRGPAPLTGTAIRIPAGGRYDLTFTAPATPVALFVDGRAVYSTGPVGTATGGWPVLDPLGYGAAPGTAPLPAPDRKFTLVLDRGLDLHGLVPRYAHTVNGAAYPDIPDEVVHLGEIVEFTIVNRSLSVHPWHLHGHHVLVLARDGTPAAGSPLWLDSFDVRPGEVWRVAFRADNPGMWANHCHNLPHADQGMMLHLRYA